MYAWCMHGTPAGRGEGGFSSVSFPNPWAGGGGMVHSEHFGCAQVLGVTSSFTIQMGGNGGSAENGGGGGGSVPKSTEASCPFSPSLHACPLFPSTMSDGNSGSCQWPQHLNPEDQPETGIVASSSLWSFLQSPCHLTHGGHRQPMCDPEGCSTVWGAVEGGTPPPFVDPNPAERGTESEVAPKWARWLHNPCRLGGPHRFKAGGRIRGGPQVARWLHNPCSLGGPHRFKAGNLNKKKSRPITTALANAQTGSHQPRSNPEAGSGSKSFFVLFSHF